MKIIFQKKIPGLHTYSKSRVTLESGLAKEGQASGPNSDHFRWTANAIYKPCIANA